MLFNCGLPRKYGLASVVVGDRMRRWKYGIGPPGAFRAGRRSRECHHHRRQLPLDGQVPLLSDGRSKQTDPRGGYWRAHTVRGPKSVRRPRRSTAAVDIGPIVAALVFEIERRVQGQAQVGARASMNDEIVYAPRTTKFFTNPGV